ncbi:hypothetical protein T492DRAFT_956915 [Pavlovales sp. CCMP2436]|nr:hypothetical protein T492DRAFT_956915 [Pavlovales sp. CCMP2436]|mmetsp:Transcript_44096/g.109188  ORF Transcript_44096/g.109188 Transcript_44096/m.109188 type:complete len:236 (-) Transcript_44096:100-807(-)
MSPDMPQVCEVEVPACVQPGASFDVVMGGRLVSVTCPVGATAAELVRVNADVEASPPLPRNDPGFIETLLPPDQPSAAEATARSTEEQGARRRLVFGKATSTQLRYALGWLVFSLVLIIALSSSAGHHHSCIPHEYRCHRGGCDQRGCVWASCDGGICNQLLVFDASCDGGCCNQDGTRMAQCDGARCSQRCAAEADCDGGGCDQPRSIDIDCPRMMAIWEREISERFPPAGSGT